MRSVGHCTNVGYELRMNGNSYMMELASELWEEVETPTLTEVGGD